MWSENEKESTDNKEPTDKEESEDLPLIPSLEGDQEGKEGKGLKILTRNKSLTRLPILLAQIKAGKNTYKLENQIRQANTISFVSA